MSRSNLLCIAAVVAVVVGAYAAFKYSLAIRVDTAQEAAGVVLAEYERGIDGAGIEWSVTDPSQGTATRALTGSRDGNSIARVELRETWFGWEQVAYRKLNARQQE